MATEDLLQELEALKSRTIETDKDYFEAEKALSKICDSIYNNWDLLTAPVLDALTDIAMNSPHRDIHEARRSDVRQDSPQDPAHQFCLRTLRTFRSLASPQNREAVIRQLEKIASESDSFDLRFNAVGQIGGLSYMVNDPPQNRAIAFAALERLGDNNSDPLIRTIARDDMLPAAKEDKNFVARAMAAQIKGTEDEDAEARTRATALLTNRVQSPSCSTEEVISLLHVFKNVADRTPFSEIDTLYYAANGLTKAAARLKTGVTTQWSWP